MWWLELLAVALFAMGWWPCGGCIAGPGTNNACNLYCTGSTTPDEVTIVIGSGAVAVGGSTCTNAQCAGIAGTYILPHNPSPFTVGVCGYELNSGSQAYLTGVPSCLTGTSRIRAYISADVGGPDINKRFWGAEIYLLGVNAESGRWEDLYTTSNIDCCGTITPAKSIPYLLSTGECDYSAVTTTLECT